MRGFRVPLAAVLGLIIWSVLSLFIPLLQDTARDVFPAPWDVARNLVSLGRQGVLHVHILTSLGRVLLGFSLAALFALPLGVLMGRSATFRAIFGPLFQLLRPVPPFAWIPLALLWFGLGLAEKTFVIAIGAFFPILIHTEDGAASVEEGHIQTARSFGASSWQLLRAVVIPSALPQIFLGLRVGLGFAWACVVAAELVGSARGLGFLILDSRNLGLPSQALAGMVLIGVVGFAIDRLLQALTARTLPWTPQERRHGL